MSTGSSGQRLEIITEHMSVGEGVQEQADHRLGVCLNLLPGWQMAANLLYPPKVERQSGVGWGGRLWSLFLVVRALILSRGPCPHILSQIQSLSRIPPLNAIPSGAGASARPFGEGTHIQFIVVR